MKNNNLLNRIDIFLGEGKFLGWKKKSESITTVSAGVPGEGPIADVQNGLSGQTQEFKDANKKNKKLIHNLMRRQPNIDMEDEDEDEEKLDEYIKINSNDLIEALGGIEEIKKMGNTFNIIWDKILKKIDLIENSFNISLNDIDIKKLKEKLKNLLV